VVSDSNPVAGTSGKFTDGGVFSERIFGRLPSSGRDYSCNCGELNGRFYEGMCCLTCKSEVVCRDTVFSKRGWIDFAPYRIVSPLFYCYLSRAIGVTQIRKILRQNRVLTADGVPREGGTECGPGYENLGLLEFTERWEEVLDFYERKRGSDPKVIENIEAIRANPDMLFTSRIPVYNHILRPALLVEKQLRFDEVNNVFNNLVANTQNLKEYSEAERTGANVNAILWRIQEKVMEAFEHVMKAISGKNGYLRSRMLGLRINFSSRCVITPLPTGHEQDEVHIPYLAFLELYRFQLTNLISRTRGVGIRQANELWHQAQTTPDRTVMAAMREMIRRANGLPALLNRNPTIAFGSFQKVRITGVKTDINDYTMSVSNLALASLGGDFDGWDLVHCRFAA